MIILIVAISNKYQKGKGFERKFNIKKVYFYPVESKYYDLIIVNIILNFLTAFTA